MTEKKLGRSTQAFTASAGRLVANRARIAERRGRNIATVATARKLLGHGPGARPLQGPTPDTARSPI
jgi:hypothetical protein